MKISELIKKLEKVKEDHGDLDAIYSIDDEGNAFHEVYFDPSVGEYNKSDREFYREREEGEEPLLINAVCVN